MAAETVISVDAMGGDKGPGPLIAGLSRAARLNPGLRFILHGDEKALLRHVKRRRPLRDRYEIRHAPDVVSMDEKPSRALRNGKQTSLWKSLEAVAAGDSKVAFTAGNTGAIVAMAMLVLRRAPGVSRPAIAVHWPASSPSLYNVVLDMGADIRADAKSLVQYAIMGAEYSRLAFGLAAPRVGLLNVGSEDIKGHPELHEAKGILENLPAQNRGRMDFRGFVEGNDIPADRVDVIVTDGFTGNIAMKASEGTAAMIRQALKDAFAHSFLSRIGGLFAMSSLHRLRKRIDPRRVNGGVFLGLNGGVVKSHGGADAVGHASALNLAVKLATDDFPARVAAQLENAPLRGLSGGEQTGTEA